MQDNGNAGTVMLGLDGFVLLSVSQRDGEVEQAVGTLEMEAACRCCGVPARLHDRGPTWVRDLRPGSAGDLGLGQAGLAVRRDAVCGLDLDRDIGGDPGAGVLDLVGPR